MNHNSNYKLLGMAEALRDHLIIEPHFADETDSEGLDHWTGLNNILPKFMSTSNQNLRVWFYLEIGSLQMYLAKMGSPWKRVGPKSNDQCFYKRQEREIQTHPGGMKTTWRQRQGLKRSSYKPRKCSDHQKLGRNQGTLLCLQEDGPAGAVISHG